ncbi:MAG: TonB-dependent receptor [Opitutaceae bacterium]|nr:TonB-dependent receptor [Opitutaceae bacterium]
MNNTPLTPRTLPALLALSLALAGGLPRLHSQASQPAAPADGPEETLTLSKFEVTGTQDRGYSSTNAVGGTRFNTAVVNIPQSVIVLNQQFLKDLGVRSVVEAAQYVSGISTTAGPGRDVFNVRGYQIDVTTDGLPDSSPTAQNITSPIEMVDRVEVIKGPAAVLYGSTSPGGNVNRVTKKPMFTNETTLSSTIGEGGLYYGSFDLNQTAKLGGADVAVRVMGSFEHYDQFTNFNDSDSYFISPAFAWRIARRTVLTVVPYYLDRNYQKKFGQLFQFRPYTAAGPLSFNLPRDIDWGGGYAREKFQVRRLYATLDHQVSDSWNMRFSALHKTHDEYNNDVIARDLLPDNRTLQRTWRIITTQSAYNVAAFDSLISYDVGPTKNKTLFLAQYYDTEVTAQTVTGRKLSGQQTGIGENASRDFSNLPLLDVYNPDPILLAARPDTTFLSASTLANGKVFATSLQHQIELLDGRVVASGGIRFDKTESTGRNVITGAPSVPGENEHYTKRGGIVYKPLKGLSVFYNHSETFAPIFARNPDGTGFKPTEGVTDELGLKSDLLDGRITGTVSAFKVVNKNLRVISNDPLLASAGYFEQRAKDQLEGVEFDLYFNVIENLQVIASLSSISTKTDNNLRVRNVADDTWALFASYKLDQWTFGAGARYKGNHPGDAGNVFFIEPVTVGDAFVSYRYSKDLTFQVNANNVTDKWYADSSINRNLIFAGPERRIRFSATYTFR